MAQTKLDGAGSAKMATLEDALGTLQSLHGIVEQMALAVRNGGSAAPFIQRLRRTGTPLIGQLKGQFGSISDSVSNMLLVATRGASDKARIRGLRESVASIRMYLEAAQRRVIETHQAEDSGEGKSGSPEAG